MTEYCSTCGGLPHADGEELAGPPGHLMTWGRLAPPGALDRAPDDEEGDEPMTGPEILRDALPEDAPRNALWLAQVPTKVVRVRESRGWWGRSELHILGMSGVCQDGVRFLSQWRKMNGKWSSYGHWLRTEEHNGQVNWKTVKEVLGERMAGK